MQEDELEDKEWIRLVALATLSVALGTLIGLLIAPKPGAELRQELADGLSKLRERLEQVANSIKRLFKKEGEVAAVADDE